MGLGCVLDKWVKAIQVELGFSSFFAKVLANRLIIFHSEHIFRLIYQKSMFVFCRILESKKAKQL